MSRIIILLSLLAWCSMALAGESLEEASAQWAAAFNAHDVDGVLDVYSSDAMLLPPNEPPITGAENIRAMWAEFIAGGGSTTLETVTMKSSGDVGYHVGHYAMFDTEGNTLDEGKFTELWNLVDGEWKMVSDQWSSNGPCVPAAEDE